MRGIPRTNVALAALVLGLAVALLALQLCRWLAPDPSIMTQEIHEMVAAMHTFLEVWPAPSGATNASPGSTALWTGLGLGSALAAALWLARRARAQQRSRNKRS